MSVKRIEIGPRTRFTLGDAQRAGNEWGFNCGPSAVCAVTGMTPNELRPSLGDFERKGYTNPTLMFEILDRLGVGYARVSVDRWPKFGLARIQWHGPWMRPGVPIRARYRHTHWVAYRADDDHVFDINAMCVGGWLPREEWSEQLVPWLLRECEPRADGQWSKTHVLEMRQGKLPLEEPPAERKQASFAEDW